MGKGHVRERCCADGLLEGGGSGDTFFFLWSFVRAQFALFPYKRIYSGTMVSCIVADAQMEVLDAAATESDLKAALDGARLFLISPNVLPNQVWKPISRLICPCAAMLGANISRAVLADEHDDALQADPGAGGVRPVHGADSHERGFPDAPLGSDARAICIVSLRLLSFRSQVVTMGFEKHEGMLRYEHLLLYMPEPSHVSKVSSEGSLAKAGAGSFTEIGLPHIDPEAKITKDFEDDE